MRIKRFITLALAGVLSVAALVGCGSKEESGKVTTVKVGVVGSLYEDLWKPAQTS